MGWRFGFKLHIVRNDKSTQMTQMMWICTDKNEAYKTKEVDYPENKNLRSSINPALSAC
jgi:hypothetical protein